MKILGITDTITDSGIAYVENGSLIMAVNEERFTRRKIQGGFPEKSIEYFLDNYSGDDVDKIIIGGILTPTVITRAFPEIGKIDKYEAKSNPVKERIINFLEYGLKINTRIKPEDRTAHLLKKLSKRLIERKLPAELRGKPIEFVDHHSAHGAAAYYCSNFDEALVATFDGFGDGYSSKVYSVRNGNFKELFSADGLDSFGLFYSLITVLCGYREHKHEGKITGLAAFGNSEEIQVDFPFELTEDMQLTYKGKYGKKGLKILQKEIGERKEEDIAAWVQKNTERYICKIIDHYLKESGHKNVALAGGVTANVKLNQRIHEMDGVDNIYIYPAMSDAGLSHGAILFKIKTGETLKDVYFGPSFSLEEIEKALKNFSLKYERKDNIEKEIAALLSEGKQVARFKGRMEYGPRALGNRSILVEATDPKVNESLNKKLDRTEFMPFAPVIIDKEAKKCIKGLEGAELTAKFMNISFEVTEYMEKSCPAAVHVDKTARPQIISKDDNPGFYKVLEEYNKITGLPAIINTSFNAHGEPIVRTPEEAIKSFLHTGLDYLAIDDFIVKQR